MLGKPCPSGKKRKRALWYGLDMVAQELTAVVTELTNSLNQLTGKVGFWDTHIAELIKGQEQQATETVKLEEWFRVKDLTQATQLNKLEIQIAGLTESLAA